MPHKITIVLPLYNEEQNVLQVYTAIKKTFAALPQYHYDILMADDGSTDNTLAEIKKLYRQDPNVQYISLSRNFGKDNALMAGLQFAAGDAVITMDADLQHPAKMIPILLHWWVQGFEVVYTYREQKNRYAGPVSQLTSTLFYKTINRLSDVNFENGISDFRLMDAKVVTALLGLNESKPFLRGLLKWTGFKQKGIPYTPLARQSGHSKYNYRKLFGLAVESITSFSTRPLVFAIYAGFFFSAAAVFYIPYVIYSLYTHIAISGWASIIVSIGFFCGLQLMILGIIGLYLGKVFMEVKERPRFIISESSTTAGSFNFTRQSNDTATNYTAHV